MACVDLPAFPLQILLKRHPEWRGLPAAVVDEDRQVLAGPLVLTRRRAYHREWLIGFAGLTSRDAVDGWRDQFLAVPEDDAGG
jgi:hypothetical protein